MISIFSRIGKFLGLNRSIENPTTPLNDPDDWLYDALGSAPSSAGTRVSRHTALTYAAVWRAVNLISSSVAKIPILVYRRDGKGKVVATDHPAYRLLRRGPNEYMTAFTWKQTAQQHLLLCGNSYSYIERREDGSPSALLPLSPELTAPLRVDGVLWYVTKIPGSNELRKLRSEDVLHIPGMGFDGLCGYSVITYARESIGLGLAARYYGTKFFRNNARPSIVLEHPGKLTDEAMTNIRNSWERLYSGLENAHRPAILREGMRLTPYGINARDSQLLESRQFEVREIANFFGVPPHKIGDQSRAGYNSLEQEDQSFLDDTLDPWFCSWEEECWRKLMTEEEKSSESCLVSFDRSQLVRANLEARGNYYTKAIQWGWMSPDEARDREGLNPREDGKGGEYLRPLNMVSASDTAPAGNSGGQSSGA